MTKLRSIFEKDVGRPIEGVIKADDEASLRTEVEEYVLTQEIERQLARFLDAYNDYRTANGVWISGFFGSGKSHLLKMLALLLENRSIDGTTAYDLFREKCAHDEILSAELRRAVAIPSRSVLFNIDQKADVIAKDQVDALLGVFQKVFDEACGYYGKQPHIAQFERDLDSRSLLVAFREAYAGIAGKPWERGREQALLEGANIARAYATATGGDAVEVQNILGRYRQDFRVSIEDFAEKVHAYIETQPAGFRLNFFVDEVGQYIADNVKLMTNLQTIAESLNTRCRGRAWIIVTAQQDMAAVVGDMNQRQENDFSKIQARFANRMPLTSADVDEVIQKRLLAKTAAGAAELAALYDREANNLRTLFDFTDNSVQLAKFRDSDHFIQSYPFPAYQYPLFQQAIQHLSQHNAFEGRHSSVGERSMLGVFQEVAKSLTEIDLGGIATFDRMYDGISSALKANVQQSVLLAENNLDDAFAIRVLKALFLVKYVRQFRSTSRNVAILMLDRFDADMTAHRRRVEEALGVLEQQTYIQRNGDLFEFLTDEEKDVEKEIKAVDIDLSEIAQVLEALMFEETIKLRRIRHDTAQQEYGFARKLDDRLLGRSDELAINVITPQHDFSANHQTIMAATMNSDELAVLLKADSRFMEDVRTFKRTDKYVRQAGGPGERESIQRIVSEKGQQNQARRRELAARARVLVAEARLFVRGEEIEVRSEDPQVRIARAFQTLVDKVHVNLGMLRGVAYAEADIGAALRQADGGLFTDSPLGEAELDILNFVLANDRRAVRTTVKAVVEQFAKKPYGWGEFSILATTASLMARGRIDARRDGDTIEGATLEAALRNTQQQANVVLELQVEFTAVQVKRLRDFYAEFFDRPAPVGDPKTLSTEVEAAFANLLTKVEGWLAQQVHYPFLTALTPVRDRLRTATGKAHGWYILELPAEAEALLDDKEDLIDPIGRFMEGAQRGIYDDARLYLTAEDANFDETAGAQAMAVRTILDDPRCFKGNAIQQMKAVFDALKAAVSDRLAAERSRAIAEIDDMREKLTGLPEYVGSADAARAFIAERFSDVSAALQRAHIIAVIRDKVGQFRASVYPALLARVLTPPAAVPAPGEEPVDDTCSALGGSGSSPAAPPQVAFVPVAALRTSFPRPFLGSESDIDTYLDMLRDTLMTEIRAGKRITI